MTSGFGRARVTWICLLATVVGGSRAPCQQNDGLFSLIRDEARQHKIEDARARLKQGREAAAVELLLDVLQASPAATIERGGGHLGNYVGLRQAARDELAKLTGRARKVYEELAAAEAEPRLRDALEQNDPRALTQLALRFPHSAPARRARLTAGDRFLERGRILRALQEFALLDTRADDAAVAARRVVCRSLLGLRLSEPELPEGKTLPFGLEALPPRDWLKRIRAFTGLGYPESIWPAYGGGLDGSRVYTDPVDPMVRDWQRPIRHADDSGRFRPNLHPVADGRRIFVNTGTRLYGIDLLTGDGWESVDHIDSISSALQREQFLDSVSFHFAHSSALGSGLVVAPIQVPIIPDFAKENQNFNGIPIMRRLPVRRLHAFEAETGRLVWTHWEPGKTSDNESHTLDVSGPPLIVDDTVYVPTHKQLGTIAFYISAFDLRTGVLKWRTLICSSQIEVNMFGNAQLEYAASPLAYSDGVLYGSTNLGISFAVRADDGSIDWLQSYEIIEIPRAQMRPEFRFVWWANNPPVVTEELVILTPLDSESALALERGTGQLRWKQSYQVDDRHRTYELRWLLGVSGDEAWFSGQCLVARPITGKRERLVATPALLGQGPDGDSPRSIPRGLLTDKRVYYLSSSGGMFVLRHDGTPVQGQRRHVEASEIGNLCSSGGVLASVRPQYVTSYFSLERLITAARNLAAKHPRDPEPALAYAERFSARQNLTMQGLEKCAGLYRKVLDLCEESGQGPGSPLALRARGGLFRKLTELGRTKFQLAQTASANKHRREAIDLGRELYRQGALLPKDLVRFYTRLLGDYRDPGDAMRELVLDRLEKEHGDQWHEFGGSIRTRVGAFVIVQRLSLLPEDETNAARRLALLRKLLVQYGTTPMPIRSRNPERGRAWALRRMVTLLDRHGRKPYEPFEEEAARLFKSSGEDTSRLQAILDQYPLSKTAEKALVRLSVLAASNRDLRRALEAYSFGLTRMPTLPSEMLTGIAAAARANGNEPLHDALLARAEGRRLPAGKPDRSRELRGIPRKMLQHEPRLSTNMYGQHVAPRRMPGIHGDIARDQQPLLFARKDSLYGLRPRKGKIRYRGDKPDFRVLYTQPYRAEVDSALCGDVLILAEDRLIRGLALSTGKLLWMHKAGGRGANESTFELAGPLACGLYCISRTPFDPQLERSRWVSAIEPLTGAIVFERKLEVDRAPEIRNGCLFRFEDGEPQRTRIVLMDPLTGADTLEIPLDGKTAPMVAWAPRNVMITADEVFLLVPRESTSEERSAGLWCFSRAAPRSGKAGLPQPKLKWVCPTPRVEEGDNYFVGPDEVFLTLGFLTGREGAVWRLARKTGERRPEVKCGAQAMVLGHPYGSDAKEIFTEPLLMVGNSDQTNAPAKLTMLDPRPGGVSWSVRVPRLPSAELGGEFPAPAYSDEVIVIGSPFEQGNHRYIELMLFDRKNAKRIRLPDLQRKIWNAPAQMTTWNGNLLLRSDRNGWVFSDMMRDKDAKSGR